MKLTEEMEKTLATVVYDSLREQMPVKPHSETLEDDNTIQLIQSFYENRRG